MPLLSWRKWPRGTAAPAPDEASCQASASGDASAHVLITELLWHVKERERVARELEQEQRLAHSALGLPSCQRYPRLRTLLPTSELHQPEILCAQFAPTHAAIVLSRFREVLATNNVMPWELVSVFKRVLRDFLNQKKCDNYDYNVSVRPPQLRPMESWTSRYKMKQRYVTPTVPSCSEKTQRNEIPTVSGYVDRVMQRASSFPANWECPYHYQSPVRYQEA
ncbi:unnamed protein product [Lampetra planeri]